MAKARPFIGKQNRRRKFLGRLLSEYKKNQNMRSAKTTESQSDVAQINDNISSDTISKKAPETGTADSSRSNLDGIPDTINLDDDIEVVFLDELDGSSTQSANNVDNMENEYASLPELQDNVSGCTSVVTDILVDEDEPLSAFKERVVEMQKASKEIHQLEQVIDMQKATKEIDKLTEALASAYTMLTAYKKQNEELHKVLKKAKLPPYDNVSFRSIAVQTTASDYMLQENEYILPDDSSGVCQPGDTPKPEIIMSPTNIVMSNTADMATLQSIPIENSLPIQNHKSNSYCKILPKILRRITPEKPYNIKTKPCNNSTVNNNNNNQISVGQTPNLQFLSNVVQSIDQTNNKTLFYIIPMNSDTNQSNLNITQELQGNAPLNSPFVIPMYQPQQVIPNPTPPPKPTVNKAPSKVTSGHRSLSREWITAFEEKKKKKITSSSELIDDKEYALAITEVKEEPNTELNSLLAPPPPKEVPTKSKKNFASDDIEDNLPHAIIVNSGSNNVISKKPNENTNSVQVYTVLNSIDLTETNKKAPKKSRNLKNMKQNENLSDHSTDLSMPSIVSTVSLAPNQTDSMKDYTEMPSIVSVQSLSTNTDWIQNAETDIAEISQNDPTFQKVFRKTLNFGIVRP